MKLEFDRARHLYRLDGNLVPSVTQVLEATFMLPDYSKLDPYYRERGSKAHAAIHIDLTRGVELELLDEDDAMAVERFRRFAEAVKLEPIMLEQPLADPVYRYAGTPDFYGTALGEPWVLDWKRGAFEAGHAIQVAGGYLPLVRAWLRAQGQDVPKRIKCGVVSLNTALPSIEAVDHGPQPADIFRSALAVYHWRALNMAGYRNPARGVAA